MPLSSKLKYFGVLSFYLFSIQLQAEPVQTAVISEFLTNNNKGLEDSNGQNYDWIEISNVNRELIQNVNIFDIYEGENIPKDKKSIALNVTIQSMTKTLKDKDLEKVNKLIIDTVENKTGAKIRS